MIRKLAVCAVVAFIPGLALAASPSTNGASPATTGASVTGDTKGDATVNSGTAVKSKVVKHRVAQKAKAKVKTQPASETKAETPKL